MGSIIITIMCIQIWIRINTKDAFIIDENGDAPGSFKYVYEVVELMELYKLLSSLNVILFFMNIMRYMTFSSKLSTFYEILLKSISDIALFIAMFFITVYMYALVGHIVFGMTDETFESMSESTLTIFMLIIGNRSILQIETYYETIRTIFGVTLILTGVILLNMQVAIVGSHYFEYYLEQENVQSNFFKLFIESYIGSDQIQEPQPTDNFCKRLALHVKNYLIKWASQIVTIDDNDEYRSKFVLPDSDILEKEIRLAKPERILSVLASYRMFNDREIDLKQNMTKLHFWVMLLDNAVGNDNYFQKMKNSRINLLSIDPNIIYINRNQSALDISAEYDDHEVMFCMSSIK